MTPFIIGAALVSVFPIMFLIEDLEDSLYDPSSVHPPKKTLKQRLAFWKKS